LEVLASLDWLGLTARDYVDTCTSIFKAAWLHHYNSTVHGPRSTVHDRDLVRVS